jgi:hypothetical protein
MCCLRKSGCPGTTKIPARYIHPPRRSQDAGLRLNGRRCGRQAANGAHPASTIAFGSSSQAVVT